MAFTMTTTQAREFLSEGTRTGQLATTRQDGRPHVVPIWFVVDGGDDDDLGDLVFMTGAATAKGKALQRDPRVALNVDLPAPPYGFVLVEGTVELSTDLDVMLPYSIEIARRYMGDDQAEAFGRRNAVEGELLVRLRPGKVTALGAISE
ncbi:PPOX class F420-dependent oxidoreductase [Jatrophihabitans sp.]|uniref:PPOX class F420-dependent oxidoreductase n=1 Tax=Jatrophihabitans sp. TaxID=1932789 RepID=UPI0030C6D7A4|nr:pyridoxamine 5-phosphate oxidase-related FMN-binding protein [Jatrophihabitans sp.]